MFRSSDKCEKYNVEKEEIKKCVDKYGDEKVQNLLLEMKHDSSFYKQIAEKINSMNLGYHLTKKLSEDELLEDILNPENQKYSAFPIKYHDLWDLYKVQASCYWTPEEIDLSNDRYDFYEKLNENEQHFIKMNIAFFAQSDGIVNFGISERFLKEIQITEGIFCYSFQMMMENYHNEVYSKMLENIVSTEEERVRLFNSIETIPAIKKMADWALKWINSDSKFSQRLIANAVVEGIFFSGSFAAIFWLKQAKPCSILPGLIASNEFISRDEGLHTQFAVLLYGHLKNKLDEKSVQNIVKEGTDIAKEFITVSIPCELIGMNKEKMCNYIEFVADQLLVSLGYNKIYNWQKHPLPWINTISLDRKTNFFEKRPTEYQKSCNPGNIKTEKWVELSDSDDF